MQDELMKVRDWAKSKLQGGSEPPWAWYQYMKLVETCDAILAGMDASTTMENSLQPPDNQGAHLRLVDPTFQQETSQHHPSGLPVQMPM